jgi:hypothetical protein
MHCLPDISDLMFALFDVHSSLLLLQDDETPKLLARFKVNMMDTLAVFKAVRGYMDLTDLPLGSQHHKSSYWNHYYGLSLHIKLQHACPRLPAVTECGSCSAAVLLVCQHATTDFTHPNDLLRHDMMTWLCCMHGFMRPQVSKEDFKDVIGLLPENTPLPASDKMTYLLARLEVRERGLLVGCIPQLSAVVYLLNSQCCPLPCMDYKGQASWCCLTPPVCT